MTKSKDIEDMPELSVGDIEAMELELNNRKWGVRIRGALYQFPEHITKAEAQDILKRAATLHQTRHN